MTCRSESAVLGVRDRDGTGLLASKSGRNVTQNASGRRSVGANVSPCQEIAGFEPASTKREVEP
jgi:hypothetical protein